jgi:hypothetical protein
MVRFCGLIILPTTPPEVLAATSRVGSMPAVSAALCWSVANSALALVSEPGDRGADPPEDWER